MTFTPIVSDWDMIVRILLSLVVGSIIGLERELRGVPAGLRTNALVCIGSTLFSMASMLISGQNADPTRIAAQVAVGIGFIGGGMIFQDKNKVLGLTTAANMWVIAAIGLLIGFGTFNVAIAASIIVLALLIFGKFWERHALKRKHSDY